VGSKPTPEIKQRIVSAAPVDDDASFELKLRPRLLKEFVGQTKVKENLSVAIEAARSRGEALDHVLLYGPPGLGKTTLASIIANELGVAFQQTSGPALAIKGAFGALCSIHAMEGHRYFYTSRPRAVQGAFYPKHRLRQPL